MTKRPSKRLRLLLTDRAVNDILDIERYSIEQFGKRVANRYLAKLEAALQRISAEPGLLHREPAFHASLRFYRVEKHLLICETGVNGHNFVLTLSPCLDRHSLAALRTRTEPRPRDEPPVCRSEAKPQAVSVGQHFKTSHCQAGVAQRMANPRPRSQAFRTADRFGSRGVGREQRLRHRSVRLPPTMAPRRFDPPAGSSQTRATPPAGGGGQDPHRRSALTASVSVRPTP